MSTVTSRRRAAVIAGVVLGATVVVLGAWWIRSAVVDEASGAGAGGAAPSIREDGAARAPFGGLTEATIRVGEQPLKVVLADSTAERVQGLRGRASAAPYDGMLFVFPGSTRTAFTMAGVPEPLDIAFYAGDGTKVDQLRMRPCAGTDATCPVYQARGPFLYALETAPGDLPDGRLRGGAAP